MKLLTIYDLLINPNWYEIKENKIQSKHPNLIFWEGDKISIINTERKECYRFEVSKQDNKKPDYLKKGRTSWQRFKDYFTNTIFVSENQWREIIIPHIKKVDLQYYKTYYIGIENL